MRKLIYIGKYLNHSISDCGSLWKEGHKWVWPVRALENSLRCGEKVGNTKILARAYVRRQSVDSMGNDM